MGFKRSRVRIPPARPIQSISYGEFSTPLPAQNSLSFTSLPSRVRHPSTSLRVHRPWNRLEHRYPRAQSRPGEVLLSVTCSPCPDILSATTSSELSSQKFTEPQRLFGWKAKCHGSPALSDLINSDRYRVGPFLQQAPPVEPYLRWKTDLIFPIPALRNCDACLLWRVSCHTEKIILLRNPCNEAGSFAKGDRRRTPK